MNVKKVRNRFDRFYQTFILCFKLRNKGISVDIKPFFSDFEVLMFFSVHKCRQFYFYMDFVSELWHLSYFTLDLNYKKSSVSYYIFLFFLSSANIILQENESGRAGLKSDLTVT